MDMKLQTKVVEIINKLETKGEAYLVGGAVRDLVIGKEPDDWDMATNLNSDIVLKLFPQGKLIGKNFQVVIVDDIEIATYRQDHYQGDGSSKNCRVMFVNTIEEDLARRDFTMNALAYHPVRGLVDPFNGYQDIKNKEVKFVGSPRDRINEDYCRLLRLIRFCATLGFKFDFNITYKSIELLYPLVSLIPPERVRLELLKMMGGNYLYDMLNTPLTFDIFKVILPAYASCSEITQNKYHNDTVLKHCNLTTQAVSLKYSLLRLAALFHDIGKPLNIEYFDDDYHFYKHEIIGERLARKMLENLTFSNDEVNYICEIIKYHMFFIGGDKTGSMKKCIRRLQSKLEYCTVRDIVRLRIADRKGNKKKTGTPLDLRRFISDLREVERENSAVKLRDLAINGNDIMKEFSIKPGVSIGIALNHCLEHIIEWPEDNIKEILLDVARGILTIFPKEIQLSEIREKYSKSEFYFNSEDRENVNN